MTSASGQRRRYKPHRDRALLRFFLSFHTKRGANWLVSRSRVANVSIAFCGRPRAIGDRISSDIRARRVVAISRLLCHFFSSSATFNRVRIGHVQSSNNARLFKCSAHSLRDDEIRSHPSSGMRVLIKSYESIANVRQCRCHNVGSVD